MNEIKVLGIDLGKDVCSIIGLDEAGNVVLRRRMRRDSMLKLAAGMPACVMAMEACCGAHHLGRQLRSMIGRGLAFTFRRFSLVAPAPHEPSRTFVICDGARP